MRWSMKKIYYLLSMLVSLLLLSCLGNRQTDNLEFELDNHILENSTVLSISFEDDGTAWLSSLNGYGDALTRVAPDGQITVFDEETALLDPETSIRDIEVDSQGRVWIANNGLIKYEDGIFIKYDTLNSILPANRIRSITVDSNDKVWVSSLDFDKAGLVVIENDVMTLYNEENSGIPCERVMDIEADNQGNNWILAMGKFYKYNGSLWREEDISNTGFTPAYVSDFAIDQDGRICAVMNYAMSSTLYEDDVPVMFIHGVDHTLVFYSEATNFPSICVDNNNRVWFSDLLGGLKYYDGQKLISTNFEHGASTTEVAPDGKLWVGSDDGVFIYNSSE